MNSTVNIILTESIARVIIEGINCNYSEHGTDCESLEEKYILGLIKDTYPELVKEFSSVYRESKRYI